VSTPGAKGTAIEERLKKPLMTAARKFGMKKRNPITATMPGWPAPKSCGMSSKGKFASKKR
jgi:hypothetical protein